MNSVFRENNINVLSERILVKLLKKARKEHAEGKAIHTKSVMYLLKKK